jgi:hypothetical protein
MRTTLTIEDDVVAALERLRRTRNASLKDLINEALRRGIRDMTARSKRTEPFRTRTASLGEVLVGSIDNIAETLAVAEDESFK